MNAKADATRPPPMPMAYNDFYKTNGSSSVVMFEGPSMTRQEFAEECDINSIMKRYEQAGTSINNLPNNLPPIYVDWAEMPQTLMEYMDFMHQAEASFMTLPAVVRKEFDNDPVQFVEYASDPGNLDQMRTWGLAPPKPPEKAGDSPPPAGGAPGAPAPEPAPKAPGGAATHAAT